MFIAMNRFRVKKGSEDAFEKVWLGRALFEPDELLLRTDVQIEFEHLRACLDKKFFELANALKAQ